MPASIGRPRSSARYWCTTAIAMLPSPTPDATRLIDPCRTSPAAVITRPPAGRRRGRCWEASRSLVQWGVMPHRRRRLVKATEVYGHGLARAPPWQHEMHVVGLAGDAVRPFVHHEIAAARLDRELEALDRLEQRYQLVARLPPGERDTALPQAGAGLRHGAAKLFLLLGIHECSLGSSRCPRDRRLELSPCADLPQAP